MKEEKVIELKGEKSLTELEAKLKKQFQNVTKVVISGPDKTDYTVYLREPTLTELDSTLAGATSNPVSSSVGLFRSIFVGGDKELLNLVEKASFAVAVHKEVSKVIPVFKTESMTL